MVKNAKQFRTFFQVDNLTINNSVMARGTWCIGKEW